MTVAVEAVAASKQKTKMQMLTSSYAGNGGKPTTLQFWRWAVLLTIIGSSLAVAMWALLAGVGDFIRLQQGSFFFGQGGGLGGGRVVAYTDETDDSQCIGRRVYMYDLPPQFNTEVLDQFCLDKNWWLHMCGTYNNTGFGLKMEGVMEPVEAWYTTEQFALEVILHERFKVYKCLTNNPDMADLFFLPYYVGLDLSINIFSDEAQMKDLLLERFLGWLLAQPTFMEHQGNNHFMALSRIVWDFTRQVEHGGWGNSLLNNYELQNVTKLMIERDGRSEDFRQMAIPYPTSFHPRSDTELQLWQKKVSEAKREKLGAFAGAPRNATKHPNLALRDILFSQCDESDKCETLLCSKVDCPKNPHFITNLFLSSKFCFQPPGDSPTRKAVFDCLVAGSIPVFFTPATAHAQYLWHLPAHGSSYSVLLDEMEVLATKENVLEILDRIPEEEVRAMQAVIHERIIPAIVYDLPDRDPNKKAKDAFDTTLEHLFNSKYQTFASPDGGDVHAPSEFVRDSSEVES
ncbi:unnamed protein product [Calypogeia fissa]